jgi:hypothetical protein
MNGLAALMAAASANADLATDLAIADRYARARNEQSAIVAAPGAYPYKVGQAWIVDARLAVLDIAVMSAAPTGHAPRTVPVIYRFTVVAADAAGTVIEVTRDGVAGKARLTLDPARRLASQENLAALTGLDFCPLVVPHEYDGGPVDAYARAREFDWPAGSPWPARVEGPCGSAVLR